MNYFEFGPAVQKMGSSVFSFGGYFVLQSKPVSASLVRGISKNIWINFF